MNSANIVLLVSVFGFSFAQANIPAAYYTAANKEGVPVKILYAMALAESGKLYKKKLLPWPWTMNINGQSVYCASRQVCIDQSREAINKGKSVDINVMQVNWYWHRQRFDNLEAAWKPSVNLSVGAEILREYYEQTQDWWISVGMYHSPSNKARANAYRERVKKRWGALK